MNSVEERSGALHEDRRRRVEQFIADHHHATGFDRRNILPSAILQSLPGLRAISSGGPGQNDQVGSGEGDFFVRDAPASGDHGFAAGYFGHFRDPGRRADARIRPCFAIDAGPGEAGDSLSLTLNGGKVAAHFQDHLVAAAFASERPREQANIVFNVCERARIQRQKGNGLRQNIADGFRREWNRADQKRWPEPHHLVNIQFPAITDLRTRPYVSDVFAPPGNTHHLEAGAEPEKDGRNAGRQRNNSHKLAVLLRAWRAVGIRTHEEYQ